MPSRSLRKLARAATAALRPSQSMRWTREGYGYGLVWLLLLGTGLYQQINLVLLVAGLAAGPIVSSIFVTASALRGLVVVRRGPQFVFSGDPFTIEYTLENGRGRGRLGLLGMGDVLAITLDDALTPDDPGAPAARALAPKVFFPKVAAGDRLRRSWRTEAPPRGRYRYEAVELVTRSPYGLLERRVILEQPGVVMVYPALGTLTRRWRSVFRQATETRRGRRHDRTAQQQEYHGLRDYRPGDSPRWIHWRTTARLGEPMVKEFEQQSEQDVAVLLDPWVPRTRATAEQREAVERAIRFCATVSLESCRGQGRRLLLGWTGPTPGLRHGMASTRLLHEALEALALLKSSAEGRLAPLIDLLPPPMLRDALLIVVSTRPVNLAEEFERSTRLVEAAGLRLTGRTILLDAARGDLDPYIRFDADRPVEAMSSARPPSATGGGNGKHADDGAIAAIQEEVQ